jgi:hypothetical protein
MIPLNALCASHFMRIMYFRYQLLLLPQDKQKKISTTSDCVADGMFYYFNKCNGQYDLQPVDFWGT